MSKELNRNEIAIRKGESEKEYLIRLTINQAVYGLTWNDIKVLMDGVTGHTRDESTYRKQARRLMTTNTAASAAPVAPQTAIPAAEVKQAQAQLAAIEDEELHQRSIEAQNKIWEMRMERMRMSDDRTQINAMLRRMSREDSLKEIAREAVRNIKDRNLVLPATNHGTTSMQYDAKTREAILCISDWHHGKEICNYFNVYNPDVTRERICKLRDETIEAIQLHKVRRLHVLNLGDMIAGRIHLQLRVNSRFDVITQTIEVSELLAAFLSELNQYVQVDYYDTLDNHSRLEPNLKESLELESLCRITTWYLKERMKGTGVVIHDNPYGDDIITLNVLGHEIAGVHGHNDKPERVVQNMQTRTRKTFDLIVAAHYHHFKADESAETAVIYNGSLMGTDEYAEKLRLASIPSQNLFIVSEDNPTKAIYKINLN